MQGLSNYWQIVCSTDASNKKYVLHFGLYEGKPQDKVDSPYWLISYQELTGFSFIFVHFSWIIRCIYQTDTISVHAVTSQLSMIECDKQCVLLVLFVVYDKIKWSKLKLLIQQLICYNVYHCLTPGSSEMNKLLELRSMQILWFEIFSTNKFLK